MFGVPAAETPYDRKLRMLEQVKRACLACTMCELGRVGASRDGKLHRDPHVFSNMNPTRFVVVGQNPGWTEVEQCEPFVGDAGAIFDAELVAGGLGRGDFYICNALRCYTAGNGRPSEKCLGRCAPFLDIEINLIRPLLVVALGSVAFGRLCPGGRFADALGSITTSGPHDVPVFATYHPSPLNMKDAAKYAAFKAHVALLCALVRELKIREEGRVAALADSRAPCRP